MQPAHTLWKIAERIVIIGDDVIKFSQAEKNNGRVVLQIEDNEIPKNGEELSKVSP